MGLEMARLMPTQSHFVNNRQQLLSGVNGPVGNCKQLLAKYSTHLALVNRIAAQSLPREFASDSANLN
jgi:dihydroorotase